MPPSHADLHLLTGAFAVDAIDDTAERDRFEQHMRRCRPCTGEVRSLSETVTRLALAAAEPPPPQLRATVLAALARTRQLPPATIRHRALGRRRPAWLASPAWLAAAASLVLAAVLTISLIRVQRQLDQARSSAAEAAAVLAAPDARAATAPTSAGGTATVVFSLARRSMIFTSAGLPHLPPSKVYELWLLGPPRVRPAGLLAVSSPGRTAPLLAGGLRRGDAVGVTVEPAGGTRRPTTKPILVITLKS
jgi:anti-sigma-K factor RskA